MNNAPPLLVIDAGTTSVRAMLFAIDGTCTFTVQRQVRQYYPAPGLVEQNADEIWTAALDCMLSAIAHAGGATRVAAIGIANQRETIVFWDRCLGEPLGPAIVWQDRRTADRCSSLRNQGHEALVQARTGLLLDLYFSATKIAWALGHWDQLSTQQTLCVGTIESYLVFRLTGGLHVTDASNASRTALMAINGKGGWDDALLELFNVPRRILPEIVDTAGALARTSSSLTGQSIAITALAGDQQAATIGQSCLAVGETKTTYGTGAFVLTNTGAVRRQSDHRLLATILYQISGERCFALEGSVFAAGSLIKWLRDALGFVTTAAESEALAASVADTGGVYLVPALSGLGAPYWRPDARAALTGLSFATGRAEIVRAALEAMAYQTADLQAAFAADGAVWQNLRIDGGMSGNNWVAQDLADILDLPVERPDLVETTALGAAMLAAMGCGYFVSLEQAANSMCGRTRRFLPSLSVDKRKARLQGWRRAVKAVLATA